MKKSEVDSGKRAGIPADVADKVKAWEREVRELRQANEDLRKASTYFAGQRSGHSRFRAAGRSGALQRRTGSGCRTSLMSRPGQGSFTQPSSSIPAPGGSSVGEPAGRPMPA